MAINAATTSGTPASPGNLAASAKDEAVKLAQENKSKTSSAKSFIAGGVGGVCAVLVGQPFDMVSSVIACEVIPVLT